MKIPQAVVPVVRTTILFSFFAANLFVMGYFWVGAGGSIPVVSSEDYKLSFTVPAAHNLVDGSHVDLAGVKIGWVDEIKPRSDGQADVVMSLDGSARLHDGVRLQLREKSLLGETYVDVVDGKGPALPHGAAVPQSRITPAVSLDDVLQRMGTEERAALGSALRSLGGATNDSHAAVSEALGGLGAISREGQTVLGALASQMAPLEQLSGSTAGVLRALDTREGQIARLVTDAKLLTEATAGSSGEIKNVMSQLPGVLRAARGAGDDLSRLGSALQPVAANLNSAAPALNLALRQLPATAADLRGLLPALDGTLHKSPLTLRRVPMVSRDLIALIPHADNALANLNPMLAYIRPYGRDIAPFFTSFGLVQQPNFAGEGTVFRVMPILAKDSIKNSPVPMNRGPLDNNNAYQRPGQQQDDPRGAERPYDPSGDSPR